MSIWDKPLTKDEYMRRLVRAKEAQRKKDAELSFEDKVAIVLELQEISRSLRAAPQIQEP
jgi:hypothetical protein